MADAELHITIKKAGDPEKLGALVNAAVAMMEKPTRVVIPAGYRCQECFAADGGHEKGCSMIIAGKLNGTESVEAGAANVE